MYSPRVRPDLIPALYRLGRARGRPMTQLVSEAVERYLAAEQAAPAAPGHPTAAPDARAGAGPERND